MMRERPFPTGLTCNHMVTYQGVVDDVFEALAHRDRRALLDSLFEKDGQSLGELERQFPVTRFAIMKQLRILESAHLVTTRKVGREKRHFLNPVPIRLLADRWISRYAAPFVGVLADLRKQVESDAMNDPKHVYEIFVRAPAQEVWDILTDDSKTPLYQHFNMTSRTEWREGGAIAFQMGDRDVIVGKIVELAPPTRLVMTFHARWSPDVEADKPSRVTWVLQDIKGGACKITLVHDDFGGDTATSRQVGSGWPETLSRLKTLAETGVPFEIVPDYAPAQT